MKVLPKSQYQDTYKPVLQIHPILEQVFVEARGYDSTHIERIINRDEVVYAPSLLLNMERAAEKIIALGLNSARILVFGDYDADGVNATVTLVTGLQTLFPNAIITKKIPEREEGYGININKIREIVESENKPHCIITVDNGIQSKALATYLKDNDVCYIVTDHHQVDEDNFPTDAYTVVNPQQADCKYPNKSLSGTGVAYKLVCAIIDLANEKHLNLPSNNLQVSLLDLFALGTVGDMMSMLDLENRTLVNRGLLQLQSGARVGIRSLAAKKGSVTLSRITAEDISFYFAPHINAASRMASPQIAYDLLMERDRKVSDQLAAQLISLNTERKSLQAMLTQDIMLDMMAIGDMSDIPFIVYVFENNTAPVGLLGILASEIVSQFNKPALVMQRTNGIAHGSIRSVDGIDLTKVFEPALSVVNTFGGHKGSGGVSVNEERVDELSDLLCETVNKLYPHIEADPAVTVDMEIPSFGVFETGTINYFDALDALEPWGMSFSKPSFYIKDVTVDSIRVFGQTSPQHIEMSLRDKQGNYSTATKWRAADQYSRLKVGDVVSIVYEYTWSTYTKDGQCMVREMAVTPLRAVGTPNLKNGSSLKTLELPEPEPEIRPSPLTTTSLPFAFVPVSTKPTVKVR